MKRIFIVAACLVLCGCNNISGTLSVNTGSNLQLKDNNGQLATFVPGNATVEMKSGKLLLKGTTSNNKGDTVELDALNNLLPQFQQAGEHKFLAKDTGQPVDIDEITADSDSQSAEHDGWENCSVVVTVEVPCPPPVVKPDPKPAPTDVKPAPEDPKKPNPNPSLRKPASLVFFKVHKKSRHVANGCTADRVISGHQHIQFHFDGDNFEIQLIMTDPASGAQVASFDGFSYSSDRIVDRTIGGCDIH